MITWSIMIKLPNSIGLFFHKILDLLSISQLDNITRKVYLSISMFNTDIKTLYYHVSDINHYY